MGLSNLPPGCSSADGGIDHELESAIDALAQAIEVPEDARILLEILPVIKKMREDGYIEGLRDGKEEARINLDPTKY